MNTIINTEKDFSTIANKGKIIIVEPRLIHWSAIRLLNWKKAPFIEIEFFHYIHWISTFDNVKYAMDSTFNFMFNNNTITNGTIYSDESLEDIFQLYLISINETITNFNSEMKDFKEYEKTLLQTSEAKALILPLVQTHLNKGLK